MSDLVRRRMNVLTEPDAPDITTDDQLPAVREQPPARPRTRSALAVAGGEHGRRMAGGQHNQIICVTVQATGPADLAHVTARMDGLADVLAATGQRRGVEQRYRIEHRRLGGHLEQIAWQESTWPESITEETRNLLLADAVACERNDLAEQLAAVDTRALAAARTRALQIGGGR